MGRKIVRAYARCIADGKDARIRPFELLPGDLPAPAIAHDRGRNREETRRDAQHLLIRVGALAQFHREGVRPPLHPLAVDGTSVLYPAMSGERHAGHADHEDEQWQSVMPAEVVGGDVRRRTA